MSIRNNFNRGFSLVEVVVAVGIFALAIVGVIGLLSPTSKAVADVADSDAAARAINAIQAGLQQSGFAVVKSKLLPGTTTLTSSSYDLYASKSGDKVGFTKGTTTPAASPFTDLSEQFFEFALIRNEALSPSSPATADDSAGYLAFTISLRWPAYLPNGTKFTADAQKSIMIVPAAITR